MTFSCSRRVNGGLLIAIFAAVAVSVNAQQGTLTDEAKAVCDAHNALPENAVFGTQVAEYCYTYARNNPGVVEHIDPENVNGRFRTGKLICNRGYYMGYDENGYIKAGPCVPVPTVEGGKFGGGSPLILQCSRGYVMIVDRPESHDKLLLPNEMTCEKVPPERKGKLKQCPPGTVSIASMSASDRRRYPTTAHCSR